MPTGGTYQLLYSGQAGYWPSAHHDANIVPVVANGKVYVASYKTLVILGAPPTGSPVTPPPQTAAALATPVVSPVGDGHSVTGVLTEVSGTTLTLVTRDGEKATVDFSQAARDQSVMGPLTVGKPFTAFGSSKSATGALLATSVIRTLPKSGTLWPTDR